MLFRSQITHCLLVVNFTSQRSETEIETVRVVYQTSWGEILSFEGLKVFEQLKKTFANQSQPPIFRLFTPSRNKRDALYALVEQITEVEFDRIGSPRAVIENTNEEAVDESTDSS